MRISDWSSDVCSSDLPCRGLCLPAPDINKGRTRFSYPAGVQRIPSAIAPAILNRSFSLVARVEVPTGGGNGMLVTQGGRFGGYGLFVRHGVPRFVYNRLGLQRLMVDWTDRMAPGGPRWGEGRVRKECVWQWRYR